MPGETRLSSEEPLPHQVTFRAGSYTQTQLATLVVHVSAGVDTLLGEFGKRNFEALLNRLKNSLILRAADEGDTETLGSETTGTTDTVEVRISLVGHVVVNGDVDTLNVDTTTKNVSGYTDTSLEVLELLVTLNTVSLSAQE